MTQAAPKEIRTWLFTQQAIDFSFLPFVGVPDLMAPVQSLKNSLQFHFLIE